MIQGREAQKQMTSRDETIHREILFVAGAELENVFWPAVTGESAGARIMGLLPENNLTHTLCYGPTLEYRW